MTPLRLFFSCLILLVLVPEAQAQSPLRYGALGGYSSATQSPGEDARAGFNLAFFADYVILPYASVSLDIAYVQKGQVFEGELSDADTTLSGTATIALDYASFALAAKPSFSFGQAGASMYAVAGPRLDVLLREKLLFEGPEESIRVSIEEHKGLVWGYDVGLGFQFGMLLPAPLLAEVRFSGDFTNASNGATRPTTRNQVVQVRIGIEI